MRVGSWFVGVGSYFGLMLGIGLAMWLAARVAARVLGVKQFRWFREPELPTAQWKLVAVRIAAALAPWGMSAMLFWASLVIEGTPAAPTTQVEVFPDGGASRGGMLTGDRVLSIGGQIVQTWEALRAAVPRKDEPVTIALERDGQRLELVVTPQHGRIGVAPRSLVEHVGAGEAAVRALGMPWKAASSYATSLMRTATGNERPDLAGPVGIVRLTSGAERSGWLLQYLALLSAYFAAFFGGVPLFDAATSWLFRWRHPAAAPAGRPRQLERCRQAVLVSGAGYVVFGLLLSLAKIGVPGLLLALAPLSIIWMALVPLTWSGGGLVWGRGTRLLLMGASTLVPCASLFVAIVLHRDLSRALSEEGGRAP